MHSDNFDRRRRAPPQTLGAMRRIFMVAVSESSIRGRGRGLMWGKLVGDYYMALACAVAEEEAGQVAGGAVVGAPRR